MFSGTTHYNACIFKFTMVCGWRGLVKDSQSVIVFFFSSLSHIQKHFSCVGTYKLIHSLSLSGVYGVVILIGQDGVQRPPIRFPTTGSLLSFLNCLENGLHPHGELDPPLFNPRSKGLGLPRLKRPSAGDNVSISKGENTNQDYVFRLVSGTKPEDLGMCLSFYCPTLVTTGPFNI